MNNALLILLSVIGLLAIYWVLIGQWKWNNQMRLAEEKSEELKNKNNLKFDDSSNNK